MIEPLETENFFRHQYGKLVASLTKRVGIQFLDRIEDAAQSALLKGLEKWSVEHSKTNHEPNSSIPDNPSAWLFKVATNHLLDDLRQKSNRERLLNENSQLLIESLENSSSVPKSGQFNDDLLDLLFKSCHPEVPMESQLVFALKLVCGFSNKEIAYRLFISEENAYKRFSRARNKLEGLSLSDHVFTKKDFFHRVPAVNKILYLLFTEGYLSTTHNQNIRIELCSEALRLSKLVAVFLSKLIDEKSELNSAANTSQTYALVALMYFHLARLSSRKSQSGGLLLLEEQDRSLWNRADIFNGFHWLEKSSIGNKFSRYHAEAGIAAEHCIAASFESTRWQQIAEIYELLELQEPSAIHRLNHAVAIAEWKGPTVALEFLNQHAPPSWLQGSYLWSAVLADLNLRIGNFELAELYREAALGSSPTPDIRTLLERRLTINSK